MKYAPDSAILGSVGHMRRRWDRWGRTNEHGLRGWLPQTIGGAIVVAWIIGSFVLAALIIG